MIEMELIGVEVELPFNTPVVLLREAEGGRVLPIVIDVPEAQAIHRALDGIRMARPMTHDLMAQMLTDLEAELVSVTITELRDRTFFAELVIELSGRRITMSARPSDSVALAVRTGTPIFASEAVLAAAGTQLEDPAADDLVDSAGAPPSDLQDTDPAELLDEFKQFLDDLNPEDFEG